MAQAAVELLFFPQVLEWVGQSFPTYYLFNPIIEMTQHGGAFSDVWLNAAIFLAFDLFHCPFVVSSKKQKLAVWEMLSSLALLRKRFSRS